MHDPFPQDSLMEPHVRMLRSKNSKDCVRAARALYTLTVNDAPNQVRAAAAGAIPPLVALLGPQSSAEMQELALDTLRCIAYRHTTNQFKIIDAEIYWCL